MHGQSPTMVVVVGGGGILGGGGTLSMPLSNSVLQMA